MFELLLLTAAALAGSGLSKEDKLFFEWFDSLGYKAVVNKQYVVLAGGGEDMVINTSIPRHHGFLAEEKGPNLKVITFDLKLFRWVEKRPVGNLARWPRGDSRFGLYSGLGWNEDFSAYVKSRTDWTPGSEPEPLSQALEYFVLARACQARGLSVQRDKALKISHEIAANDQVPFARAIHSLVDDAQLGQIYEEFSDVALSRFDLLRRFQTYLKQFPSGPHYLTAKLQTERLEQTVAENVAHRRWLKTPLHKLPPKERVKAAIFCLREIRGKGWGWDRRSAQIDELIRDADFAAVPALIRALDDRTFSRHTDHGAVVTVGELALDSLGQISGFRFNDSHDAMGLVTAKSKAAVMKWWHSAQSRGESAMMLDRLQTPDTDSLALVTRLADKYPASAYEPLMRVYRQKTIYFDREALVYMMAEVPHPASFETFLSNEMLHGDTVASRSNAASYYAKYHPAQAMAMIRREWVRMAKSGKDADRNTVSFLAYISGLEGIRILSDSFGRASPDFRAAILADFSGYQGPGLPKFSKSMEASMERARKALFDRALRDERLTSCSYESHQGQDGQHLRVCDVAIWQLVSPGTSMDDESFEALETLRWKRLGGFKGGVPGSILRPRKVLSVKVGAKVPDATKRVLDSLEGQDLSAAMVAKALSSIRRAALREKHSLALDIRRFSGRPGIYVEIRDLGTNAYEAVSVGAGGRRESLAGPEGMILSDEDIRTLVGRALAVPGRKSIGIWIEAPASPPDR